MSLSVRANWGSVEMDEQRGVVLETDGPECSVLTRDGRFLRVRTLGKVGDEVLFSPIDVVRIPRLARWGVGWVPSQIEIVGRVLTYAAVIALAIGISLSQPPQLGVRKASHNGAGQATVHGTMTEPITSLPAVAYVTVDINPSIELAVDSRDFVIRAVGLNTDGECVLGSTAVIGTTLREAIGLISRRAYELGYFQETSVNEILLTATLVNESASSLGSLDDELEEAKTAAIEYIADSAPNVRVSVSAVEVTKAVRQKATEAKLSVGKYIVLDTARSAGIKLSPDDVRKSTLQRVLSDAGLNIDEIVREYDSASSKDETQSHQTTTTVQRAYQKTTRTSAKPSVSARTRVDRSLGKPAHSTPETTITVLPTMRYEEVAETDIDLKAPSEVNLGTFSDKRDLVKKVIIQFDLFPPADEQTGQETADEALSQTELSDTPLGDVSP